MATHSMCQPGRPRPRLPPSQLGSPRGRRATARGRRGSSCPGGPGRRRVRPTARAWRPRRGGDAAEVRVGVDLEVDVAVQLVGRAGLAQPLDQRDDPRDGLDGADVVGGRQHPQRGHVLAEQGGLALGEGRPVLAGLVGPLQQRVVDVGDVLDVVDLALRVQPHALHEVERVVGGRVTHVGGVVGGDPAHVDAGDRTGAQGYRATGRGVVEAEVAPGAREGRDVGSGPGMHVMRLTARVIHKRTVGPPGTAGPDVQMGGQGIAGHSPEGSG